MNIPQTLQGVPVLIAEPMKCSDEIKRTWKERLFTLPFRPFKATRTTYKWVDVLEDGKIIKMSNQLYMNAKTFNDCEKAILEKATGKKFSTTRI